VAQDNLSKPLTGPFKSLERSYAAPNKLAMPSGITKPKGASKSAWKHQGGQTMARFNDPCGNTFNAHFAPGSRKRRDTLVTEQGPMVFERQADGTIRAYRDKSQAAGRAGSQPKPFQPADYSTVNTLNNPTAARASYALERANRSAFLAFQTASEDRWNEIMDQVPDGTYAVSKRPSVRIRKDGQA
jgi:hypothetical protein